MRFSYVEALLLESIKLSEQGVKGASLIDIICTADYINHHLMTFEEFVAGTEKLKAVGLIAQKDTKLLTTELFNSWWSTKYGSKSRIELLKILEEVEKYLQSMFGKLEEPDIKNKISIAEDVYDEAINTYQQMNLNDKKRDDR